jgi:hypothetical protein
MITPLRTETQPESTPEARPEPRQPTQREQRRGGIVTYTSTTTDTGERKQMFGFVARRIKTSMSVESSPDACNPAKMRMETDGWYISFREQFDCASDAPVTPSMAPEKPDCVDQVRFKRVGQARLGYPVLVTTTVFTEDGSSHSTTIEVIELSTATLDASLFDVPAGYREVKTYQELMGLPSDIPSIESLMRQRQLQEQPEETAPAKIEPKRAGMIRIGVLAINNRADQQVQTTSLRNQLINGIIAAGVDAVPIDAVSPAEIEAEARKKDCDFVLHTDIATLKKSSGGGMLGKLSRATGVGGIKEKYESKLEYKLFPVGNPTPQLASSASGKGEGDSGDAAASSAVGSALEREANTVAAEARKKR